MKDVSFHFINKPAGAPMARPAEPFYKADLLDSEASGLAIAPQTQKSADLLKKLLEEKKVSKTYLFVTDRKSNSPVFKVLAQFKNYSLIEYTTADHRPQQIRKDARAAGIPLLGDKEMGGSSYLFLFLHCLSIHSPDLEIQQAVPAPLTYENLDWLDSPLFCRWMRSYERRAALYPEKLTSDESLRLIHKEGTPLRIDKLGSVAAIGWWDETPPTQSEWALIEKFLQIAKIENWVFRQYSKNEKSSEKSHSENCPEVWQGLENGIAFEFRRNQGISAGLFLDQRDHRAWLKAHAKGKKVLNLFAYTGGFSVYAALGNAAFTATIDLSPKYIEWSQENFKINGLSLEPEHAKFHSMDSLEYLKYASRKKMSFDFIICDPPSYSRNKGEDFRIDRDFPQLLEAMSAVLAPKGTILFSTNYENWDAKTWKNELEKAGKKLHLTVQPKSNSAWDFEVDSSAALMKAFHIKN
jgi:23S rRNA (cytosine1962-C5)-methyltransferase